MAYAEVVRRIRYLSKGSARRARRWHKRWASRLRRRHERKDIENVPPKVTKGWAD